MKHLGDITKISGYEVPITDVVIGGSPCQDLSVAGGRKGLDGERSGLFMEQLRIIKEMRDNDRRTNRRSDIDVRPRYMVWENVPGAFSTNGGEDFRTVLEETAKVKQEDAVIPRPKDGKWTTSGCVMGDGWSIAWRVLNAQFWGVPQRRRRIVLVADFNGESASEILFVRKSLSGNIDKSNEERKETSTDPSGSTGTSSCTLQERDGRSGGGKGVLIQNEKSATLKPINHQVLFQPYAIDMGGGKSNVGVSVGVSPTLTTTHGGEPVILDTSKKAMSLDTAFFDSAEDITPPLKARDCKDPMVVTYPDRGGVQLREEQKSTKH